MYRKIENVPDSINQKASKLAEFSFFRMAKAAKSMLKQITCLVLSCLLGVICIAASHPFFLSITKIDYKPEKASLEIYIKLDTENIEQVLEDKSGLALLLGEENESSVADSLIEAYLRRVFQIEVNDKALDFVYWGKDVELDVTELFLEIKEVQSISSFAITNKLLLESGDSQTNVIEVRAYGKMKGELMDVDKTYVKWN